MQISKEDALKTFDKIRSMTLRKNDESTMRLLRDIFPQVKSYKEGLRKEYRKSMV